MGCIFTNFADMYFILRYPAAVIPSKKSSAKREKKVLTIFKRIRALKVVKCSFFVPHWYELKQQVNKNGNKQTFEYYNAFFLQE